MCNCSFFKQKTADELRISDWSSDVCSSDLRPRARQTGEGREMASVRRLERESCARAGSVNGIDGASRAAEARQDGKRFDWKIVLPTSSFHLSARRPARRKTCGDTDA